MRNGPQLDKRLDSTFVYLHNSGMDYTDDLRDAARGMGLACYALQARKTANLMARLYNQAVADIGLEMSQFSTLFMIAAEPDVPVARMADALGVDRSTLTRNLALLQRDKLIARDAGKGRAAAYRLTPRGRALAAQALPRWRAVQNDIEARLGVAADPRPGMRALRQAARAVANSA